jgi:hypothetical protein
MKSKKAYIKLDGQVGEKEQPCIEYVDTGYLKKLEEEKNKLQRLFSKIPGNDSGKNPRKQTDEQ